MSKSFSSTLLSSLCRDDDEDYEEEGSSLRSLRSRALIGPRSAHLFRGSSSQRSSLGFLRLTSVDESNRGSPLYQPGSKSAYLKPSTLHLQRTTTTSSSSDQEDSLLFTSSSISSSSTSSPAGRTSTSHHVDLQRTDSGNSSLSPSASDSLSHSSSNDGTGSFNSTSLDHAFSSSAEECIEEEEEGIENEELIHVSVYVPETQREVRVFKFA